MRCQDTESLFQKTKSRDYISAFLFSKLFTDEPSFYFSSNWHDYVSDVENPDSALYFRIFSSRKAKAVRRGQSFLFTAAPNWFGTSKLKLIVKDRGGLADTTTLTVKVNPVNDPPVIRGLPDSLSFRNNTSAELNLWEFAHDVETPDSLLNFTFAASKKGLSMNFDKKTGLLRLGAPSFSGANHLYITVKDWKHAAARDTLIIRVESANVTSVTAGDEQLPTEFVLLQNYPNPFNPMTLIRFGLPHETEVKLEILNLSGQHVVTLLNGHKPAGYHVMEFVANSLASGVYFYRLTAGNFVAMKKLMLVQ